MRKEQELQTYINTQWLGHNLICLETIDSTNLESERLAAAGASHGTVVISEQQTAGKGSRGRSWESKAGTGLFMSILLYPKIEPEKASMLTLVTAYSIARVLKDIWDLEVKIKWPNDIVLNGRKVSGILTQMKADASGIQHVIVGIGVNVNTEAFARELSDKATSLYLETGTFYDKDELAGELLYRLEQDYERFFHEGNLSFMKEAYEMFLINQSKPVRIIGRDNDWAGIALGINEAGELLIQRPNGTIEAVASGEVSVRGLYSYV